MYPQGDKRELVQMASLFTGAFMDWKSGRTQRRGGRETALQRRAREEVWKLRRAFETAVDASADEVVRDFFRHVPTTGQARAAFVSWVNLLETLVQETEIDYGTAKGQGRIKAAQVKAVALRILVDEPHLRLPNVPAFLTPVIVEMVVDAAVDAVVLVLNRNHLWEPAPRGPYSGGFFTWLLRTLFELGRRFMRWAPVARLGERLRRFTRWWVLKAHPVSPAVQAAIDQIQKTEGARPQELLIFGIDMINWVARNAPAVVALADVVAKAVDEAEFFASLTGPEKKEFVLAMVLAFLDDLDLIGGPGTLTHALAERVLDWVIDAVHSIFDRRSEAFGKRRHTAVAAT